MNLPTCLAVCSSPTAFVRSSDKFRACPITAVCSRTQNSEETQSLQPLEERRREGGIPNIRKVRRVLRYPIRSFVPFPTPTPHHKYRLFISPSLFRPSQGTRWQDCRPIPPRDGPWRRRRWQLRPKPSSPLGHFSSQSRICCRGGR